MTSVTFASFRSSEAPERHTAYLRLVKRVFVDELGWPLREGARQDVVAIDPHDRFGSFVVAYEDDEAVGCARGISLADSFPHQNLLGGYLAADRIDLPLARIMTVNSVAVLPAWRGRRVLRSGAGGEITLAARILELLLRQFLASGALVALLTTGPRLAQTFFGSAGFVALDPVFRIPTYDRPLVNMGAWIAASPLLAGAETSDADVDPAAREWIAARGRSGFLEERG